MKGRRRQRLHVMDFRIPEDLDAVIRKKIEVAREGQPRTIDVRCVNGTAHALLSPPEASNNASAGESAAVADMDNDGFADVFLGAPYHPSFGQANAGAVLKWIEHAHLGLCGDLDQDEDQDTDDLLAGWGASCSRRR